MDLGRIGIGLIVAATLGFVQTVHTQGPTASPSAARRADAGSTRPFRIQVSDAVIADLKRRLGQARFADELQDVGWDYGTNLAYLKELVEYWRAKYDWRREERRLNQFDQFMTVIDGVEIHFVHQRSRNANATPLLLLNGWPASVVEYMRVIGPLSDPVAHGGRVEDSFHVIIPSMPGFGFSGKPRERGFGPEQMSALWIQLMERLGYSRYVVHGSDWGGGIATRMALRDSAHVSGLHLVCGGGAPAAPASAATARPAVLADPVTANNLAHNGYQELQSTKPQTVGQALSDSPVGLASWILEKWHGWSEHDGDLEKVYTKDELLTNIMIYWVTNSGASSARIYYESRHIPGGIARTPFPGVEGRVTVPTGCAMYPWQLDRRGIPMPVAAETRKAAEGRYNLVHFAPMPRGGHFPAIEQPQLWIEDVRTFVRGLR